MGVPRLKTISLTSFAQALDILEILESKGFSNLNVIYSGWANYGMNNTAFGKISPVSSLGGKSKFVNLIEQTKSKNILLYPNSEMVHVYKDKLNDGFSSKNDATRQINRQIALKDERYLSTKGAITATKPARSYIISPNKLPIFLNNFFDSYQKYNNKNVAFLSLGLYKSSDFNEKAPKSAASGLEDIAKEIKSYDEYNTLMSGGIQAMLPYMNKVVDLPLTSNHLNIFDETIPFYPIALKGNISYAGQPLNIAGDYMQTVLLSAQTGSNLYVKWMAEENAKVYNSDSTDLHSLSYKVWLDEVTNTYKRYSRLLADTASEKIIDFITTNGISKTVFSNEKVVYVNTSQSASRIDGFNIQPQNYIVVKGGKELE